MPPPPKPAAAAAAARWKPSGPQVKLSKLPSCPDRPARRPAAEAFEALEARLALGVDLAAVEGLALVLVADDFVGGVQLGEPASAAFVVLVGVGMQLLGELAEGALDRRRARTLRHPQDLVGVAHPRNSNENSLSAARIGGRPTSIRSICGADRAGLQRASPKAGAERSGPRPGPERCVTSQAPLSSRQASPCSQVSEPAAAHSSPGNRGRCGRPGCRRWRSA